jgi:hypothetical protein
MRSAGLRLDQAPPLDIPLRFLLTGPLFGAAAGIYLAAKGAVLLSSPFHPETIALAHLVALGWISMVMVGALYQLLPVAVGVPVKGIRLGRWVHAGLVLGTAALAVGLVWDSGVALALAIASLAAAFGTVLVQLWLALASVPSVTPTVTSIRLAAVSLGAVFVLGLLFAGEHLIGWYPAQRATLVGVHILFAFGGWIGGLITGVSYVVVPMFYLAAPFPGRTTRLVSMALSVALLVGLIALISGPLAQSAGATFFWEALAGRWMWIALPAVALATAVYSGTWIRLVLRRRRKAADATLWLWRIGLAAVGAALVLLGASELEPSSRWLVGFGAVYLVGFGGSIELGMSYKIVPFLVWLHRFGRRAADPTTPLVRDLLSDSAARRQALLHLSAVILLGAAALVPPEWPTRGRLTGNVLTPDVLARCAGITLALSCGTAFLLLIRATWRGRQVKD